MKLLRLISVLTLCLVGAALEARIVKFTGGNLQAQIKQNEFTVVKYAADHRCPPCRSLTGALQNIDKDFPNVTIIVVEADVYGMPAGVTGVPYMEVYVGGKIVEKVNGFTGAGSVRALFNRHFKKSTECATPAKKK